MMRTDVKFHIIIGALIMTSVVALEYIKEEPKPTVPNLSSEVTLDQVTYSFPGTVQDYLKHGWEYDSLQVEQEKEKYIRMTNEKGDVIELTALREENKNLAEISGILIEKELYSGEFTTPYGISFDLDYEEMLQKFNDLKIEHETEENADEKILHYFFSESGSGEILFMKDEMQSIYIMDYLPYLEVKENK